MSGYESNTVDNPGQDSTVSVSDHDNTQSPQLFTPTMWTVLTLLLLFSPFFFFYPLLPVIVAIAIWGLSGLCLVKCLRWLNGVRHLISTASSLKAELATEQVRCREALANVATLEEQANVLEAHRQAETKAQEKSTSLQQMELTMRNQRAKLQIRLRASVSEEVDSTNAKNRAFESQIRELKQQVELEKSISATAAYHANEVRRRVDLEQAKRMMAHAELQDQVKRQEREIIRLRHRISSSEKERQLLTESYDKLELDAARQALIVHQDAAKMAKEKNEMEISRLRAGIAGLKVQQTQQVAELRTEIEDLRSQKTDLVARLVCSVYLTLSSLLSC